MSNGEGRTSQEEQTDRSEDDYREQNEDKLQQRGDRGARLGVGPGKNPSSAQKGDGLAGKAQMRGSMGVSPIAAPAPANASYRFSFASREDEQAHLISMDSKTRLAAANPSAFP